MFRVADQAFAPANVRSAARDAMREDLHVAGAKLQRGLLECVYLALHGSNDDCPTCRAAKVRDVDADLVAAFGIREQSRFRKIFALVRPDVLRQFLVSQ